MFAEDSKTVQDKNLKKSWTNKLNLMKTDFDLGPAFCI